MKVYRFFLHFFLELLPKFSDFINSDDCNIRITSVSSFYLKKDLNLIKKGIISSEKMMNSCNYTYDYAHSFFGTDF